MVEPWPIGIERTEETYWVYIYLAGDIQVIKQACREWCWRGACVTVEPINFIYTGGEEAGVRVGFVNYPRFPAMPSEIFSQAENLAKHLRKSAHQQSVLIVAPNKTLWLTTEKKIDSKGY